MCIRDSPYICSPIFSLEFMVLFVRMLLFDSPIRATPSLFFEMRLFFSVLFWESKSEIPPLQFETELLFRELYQLSPRLIPVVLSEILLLSSKLPELNIYKSIPHPLFDNLLFVILQSVTPNRWIPAYLAPFILKPLMLTPFVQTLKISSEPLAAWIIVLEGFPDSETIVRFLFTVIFSS